MDDAAYQQAAADHMDRVYSYAAWMSRDLHEAHDITQEAFMRLWRSRHTVDPPGARAWLLTVASRICIDGRRKRRPHTGADARLADLLAGDRPEQSVLDAEDRAALTEAWALLPMRDRALLNLSEMQGLAADEVGRILDMRPGAVRVAAHRARKRLLELLQPQEATP